MTEEVIEIREVVTGECRHGIAYCASQRKFMTLWGELEYPCPRPDRDEVGHLLLTDMSYAMKLLVNGPKRGPGGGIHMHSVTSDKGILYAHIDFQADVDSPRRSWVWRLYPAALFFCDGSQWNPPGGAALGRWPD